MSNPRVETLVLPKVHSSDDLTEVASHVPNGRRLNIIASIESARSLWSIGDIASWKENLDLNVVGLLVGVILLTQGSTADDSQRSYR